MSSDQDPSKDTVCASPMAEGCPHGAWCDTDDREYLEDFGWEIDPATGPYACGFCAGILLALKKLR